MSVPAERIPRSQILERWAYGLVAPALAIAPNLAPGGTINQIILGLGAGSVAAVAYAFFNHEMDAGRTLVRFSPAIEALIIDGLLMNTSGWGPYLTDILLAVGWVALNERFTPVTGTSRKNILLALPPAETTEPQQDQRTERKKTPTPAAQASGADAFERGVHFLWQRAGNPGNAMISHIERHPGTKNDFTLLLHALEEGQPIEGLTKERVAAAFSVHAREVSDPRDVTSSRGRQRGPGWKEVEITPDASSAPRDKQSDEDWWNQSIGRHNGPIPNSKFLSKRRDEGRGVTYWKARTKNSVAPTWNTPQVCEAFGIDTGAARIHLFEDADEILLQVWDDSPLARTYAATRALLTPDADGWYTIGYLENGQPALSRVYTPRGAAHGLFVAPTGGGKTELIANAAAAYANFGAAVMVAAEGQDEKIGSLAPHVAAQGFGALYILRLLRALIALMDIRGDMEWEDGHRHDWHPDTPGCPYWLLAAFIDEFLTATMHPRYGREISDLGEQATVKGRKYGISFNAGTQSAEVQDGASRLMVENIHENSIPILLRTPPGRITDEFKALGFPREKIPGPLPRTFASQKATGRLDRILAGQPEPPANNNTGGVGWIIEGNEASRLRTLQAFTPDGIARLFPDWVTQLTDPEIRELEMRGLWFDWSLPPGDEEDTEPKASVSNTGGTTTRPVSTAGSSALAKAQKLMQASMPD